MEVLASDARGQGSLPIADRLPSGGRSLVLARHSEGHRRRRGRRRRWWSRWSLRGSAGTCLACFRTTSRRRPSDGPFTGDPAERRHRLPHRRRSGPRGRRPRAEHLEEDNPEGVDVGRILDYANQVGERSSLYGSIVGLPPLKISGPLRKEFEGPSCWVPLPTL